MSDPEPILDLPPREQRPFYHVGCGGCFTLLVICIMLFGVALGPMGQPPGRMRENSCLQQTRQIGTILFAYATDNADEGNSYPDGKSSTEIFQKLLDGGYATDPMLFYIPLAGKIPPIAGQKLKPENVCFDVTPGVTPNAPDGLPLVFMTGYRVVYEPGASAVPLIKPHPNYDPLMWTDWLRYPKWSRDSMLMRGIAAFYKGNKTKFLKFNSSSDGSIPNFTPPDFKPDGKTYR